VHVTRDELGGEWGGMNAAITRIPAGGDLAALLRGLPGGRCPCPHWGYVIAGRFAVRYPDHEETIAAGEAYYLPPGHLPDYLEDTEVFEVSPHRGTEQSHRGRAGQPWPGRLVLPAARQPVNSSLCR
jgi:hypothetical protein